MNLESHTIQFKLKGKPAKFTVVHNLSYMGLNIESAFNNWWPRTKVFTIQSFCRYVKSKDPQIKCDPDLKKSFFYKS